ncbi:MAG: GMC oxidoreductase, partial [Gemmatimonadota bacterium]|nr:GMC oxidoreductase [Gemmatimonadota bacterium]
TGCTRCGACMMGCRVGAKNTLLKNYLWLAERRGAQIIADSQVAEIRPLGEGTGRDGFRVRAHRSGAWFGGAVRTLTARGVVVAAGALGTNRLLAKCKLDGALPRLSDRLGELVRTNSEAIHAVRTSDSALNPWNDVAISASIHPSEDTHIELVTFGRNADAVSGLLMPLTGDATGVRAIGALLGALLLHPIRTLRALWPVGWSRQSFFVLAMQTVDNAIRLRARRGVSGGVRLTSEVDAARPLAARIPIARAMTSWLAKRTGGVAQTGALEVLLGIPTTAHLLGGAVIGGDASAGVIDAQQRVFGYENLLVCDGAAVPANPGVNPALTITAMAERAMTFVPAADQSEH